MSHDHIATGIADALLAGPASVEAFAERAGQALGQKPRWLRSLARRVFRQFGPGLAYPRRLELIEFIRNDAGYQEAQSYPARLHMRRYFIPVATMGPRAGALRDCVLPDLPTPGDLAAWLGITTRELEWYADVRGMIRSCNGPLSHYNYRWVPKRHGDFRLIESPKARLCAMQRMILREMLDAVPVHPAAHGFRRGHSCITYVAPHVGRQIVIRMDLRNFFGSIPAARIHAVFRALGYPGETASLLSGLCTNRIRASELVRIPGAEPRFVLPWLERKRLAELHLPQGAPTSPALANLCARHLDVRLSALAGSVDAHYTRYADDMAISGGETLRRVAGNMSDLVAAIAMEEGFEVNFRKTRLMHRSDRQILTGIVVNEKMNVHRQEFDRLKAILHNCLRSGPEAQNREAHRDFRAHLSGRVHHVTRLNPARGARLHALLERIEW